MKASVKIDESFYSDSSSMRMVKQRSYVEQIDKTYPLIVANLIKQYQNKNIKVKVAVMKTFSVLAMLMPQEKLEEHLSSIID